MITVVGKKLLDSARMGEIALTRTGEQKFATGAGIFFQQEDATSRHRSMDCTAQSGRTRTDYNTVIRFHLDRSAIIFSARFFLYSTAFLIFILICIPAADES